MKKAIALAVIVLCLSCFLNSCTKEKPRPTARAMQIITENYHVYEPNPIYLDEANTLNELFRYSLNNRNKLNPDERRNIHTKATALYEENDEAGSAVEDAVDENRLMIRESIALSVSALVSEPKEALKYFELAKESLNEGGKTSESMEDEYSALLVLEALYLSEHKSLSNASRKAMISTINSFDTLSKDKKGSFIALFRNFK
jgi:hypothetical protein